MLALQTSPTSWLSAIWQQVTDQHNAAATVFGALGILVAILAARYYYMKGQRVRKPCWHITTTNLVRDRTALLPDLAVAYRRQAVDNLSISTITFWNAGGETIRRGDVPTESPFSVQAKKAGTRILAASVAGCNEPANRFAVAMDDVAGVATIDFEYIDKDEGVVLQVVHTGQSSAAIALRGKAMAAKALRRVHDEYTARLSFMLGMLASGCLCSYLGAQHNRGESPLFSSVAGPIVTGFMLAALMAAINRLRSAILSTIKNKQLQGNMRYRIASFLWLIANRRQVPAGLADIDELPTQNPPPGVLISLVERRGAAEL